MPYGACDPCGKFYAVDREIQPGTPYLAPECPGCGNPLRPCPFSEVQERLTRWSAGEPGAGDEARREEPPDRSRKPGRVITRDWILCPAGEHRYDPALPLCPFCLRKTWNQAQDLQGRAAAAVERSCHLRDNLHEMLHSQG
jgi:hypothetical protein